MKSYASGVSRVSFLVKRSIVDSCYFFFFLNVTVGYLLCVAYCARAWRHLSVFVFADCSWGSRDKNTGVVCHSLLQETFTFGIGGGNIGRIGWVGP